MLHSMDLRIGYWVYIDERILEGFLWIVFIFNNGNRHYQIICFFITYQIIQNVEYSNFWFKVLPRNKISVYIANRLSMKN
jgi:hypothetical protein